jgi:hypothetical protein
VSAQMRGTPELIVALVAAQKALQPLKESATNPHFNSKFAPLDQVNPAALKVLNEHGLAWATMPSILADGSPSLRYFLMHIGGGVLEGEMKLLPVKLDPQAQGSAITYARRYSVMAMLGLVAESDDDGHAATRQQPTKRAQRGPLPPAEDPWVVDTATGEMAEPATPHTAGPRPVTPEQLTKLGVVFTKAGVVRKEERLAITSSIVDRDVTSAKALTLAEAHKVIDHMQAQAKEARAAS